MGVERHFIRSLGITETTYTYVQENNQVYRYEGYVCEGEDILHYYTYVFDYMTE
jgi:hypothetical protein